LPFQVVIQQNSYNHLFIHDQGSISFGAELDDHRYPLFTIAPKILMPSASGITEITGRSAPGSFSIEFLKRQEKGSAQSSDIVGQVNWKIYFYDRPYQMYDVQFMEGPATADICTKFSCPIKASGPNGVLRILDCGEGQCFNVDSQQC